QELKTASRDRMYSAHTPVLRCTWDYMESKTHSHLILSVLLCKLNLNQVKKRNPCGSDFFKNNDHLKFR
ncbi:hypothetical protein J6590_094360, partial [Homalodisca vitripennis]